MRISRRRLITAVPAAAALGALAGACSPDEDEAGGPATADPGGRLWDIPDAAWSRAIGSHPPGAAGLIAPVGSRELRSRTKRGVPVGGIGTGSFMLNLCGSFGPWHLDIGGDDSVGARWGSPRDSGFEDRYLAQAAFHVRCAGPGGTVVKTLATEDVLPAWPRLEAGRGVYSALFPRAWFEYDGLPLPSALKQTSPFVAGDERRSSLPFGLFELALSNDTSDPVHVACMFSFPNAPYRLPTAQYDYPRVGLRSAPVGAGRIVGVRMQAESPENVAETERTEWVIAATGPSGSVLSWTEDWAADGDGSDLLAAFEQSGRLPDAPLDRRRLGLGSAVCVSFVLEPGARRAAGFCLAWDFPVVQFGNPVSGTRWHKRYTQYYPGPYRGWDIARDALSGAAGHEAAVDRWWRPIAEDDGYPLWLRTAALNELYYDLFGGVFWENGCLSKPKRFGTRAGQHLYFTLESDGFRDCESFDVRHYETRHLLQLFPTVERDVLLGWADLIQADASGRTPHDAGSPVDDPWFVVDQYSATRPGEAPVGVDWLDLPAKFVQQSHACWRYTGDDDFGAEAYAAATRTMEHLLGLDEDGDGIPDARGFCTTYDAIEMYGASTYVAALTIGACEALADMAGSFDTVTSRNAWQQAAQRARSSAEASLWVEDAGYYRLDTSGPFSSGIMSDALCGQRYAALYGLPDVLDLGRMARHLLLVYRRNVVPVGQGRLGAVNVASLVGPPTGSEPPGIPATPLGFQARAVWPGGSYFTSALMYQVGKAAGRPDLVEAALATAYGVYWTTYENDETAFWFDTPALWLPEEPLRYRSPQYQRSRAVWELLAAVKDPRPPAERP